MNGDHAGDLLLPGMLAVSVALAVIAALLAASALGRRLMDLQYQAAAGIHGVREIQALINARSHTLQLAVSSIFISTTVMRMIEAAMPWYIWIDRTLALVLFAGYVLFSLQDARAEHQQIRLLLDTGKGIVAGDVITSARPYRQIAHEAIAQVEKIAQREHAWYGGDLVLPLAAVLPEYDAALGVTANQIETADLATLRARLTSAALGIQQHAHKWQQAPNAEEIRLRAALTEKKRIGSGSGEA